MPTETTKMNEFQRKALIRELDDYLSHTYTIKEKLRQDKRNVSEALRDFLDVNEPMTWFHVCEILKVNPKYKKGNFEILLRNFFFYSFLQASFPIVV
jgi:hypothetical protein